ncbi:lysine N(6)-hydroxylase/L-ornithine N(5)-oxygenase family protein [Streptomyces prasinopilosus]|uniref:L-lysine N6-monooxygenase MbtG n=1 Tax=Streptomyces prasinopilosus TaxID=67344 RepID=A0A1G6M4W7_9ACTN|nr:SidA/IucD/PvdA family monooxygenase [Streptomyces prasinopilosus]SDC50015.1 lysine N6-hydroxylase [Streptomyces prasinopilosus]
MNPRLPDRVGARAGSGADRPHYTCVGIGAGPANLSLASLLHRHPSLPHLFLDAKRAFSWHDGQQIARSSLQVTLFKDLVTLADPTNPYSFLAYLHDQGRLYHFINAQFSEVPRQEFRDYLDWVGRRNPHVVFGERVERVEFDDDRFVVHSTGQIITADNIVVGVGRIPWLPPLARGLRGETQFHVAEFVGRARNLRDKRVCVVGGGQSGAEAFLDLISRPEDERPRRVTWVSRRSNYFPIDDSPFTNDYYTPSHADHFFRLPREVREDFVVRHVLSSDGISESTLRAIYQQVYVLRFLERAKDATCLLPGREVIAAAGDDRRGWDLTLVHREEPEAPETVTADAVVWATGFTQAALDFLDPIVGRLEREGSEFRIDAAFAVRWDGPADRNVFVQNAARRQRGLADPNLSLNAWRSRRILDRITGMSGDSQLPSFIEWSATDGPGPR